MWMGITVIICLQMNTKGNIRLNLLISFHAFESCIRRITCTPQFASWIHNSHEPYQITEIKTCTVIHCQATHLGMQFYFRNVYLNRIMEIFNAKLVQYLRPVNWTNFSLNWYCICIMNEYINARECKKNDYITF